MCLKIAMKFISRDKKKSLCMADKNPKETSSIFAIRQIILAVQKGIKIRHIQNFSQLSQSCFIEPF